ncbi:hypothetical protein IWW38_006187, partial [Coemansia aciculifera]
MYECVFGVRPFRHNKSRGQVRRAIMEDDVQFPHSVVVSFDCVAAISGLLTKSPETRLGCCPEGAARLRAHSFFASVDWDAVESRDITPLFVPDTSNDNYDKTRVNRHKEGETATTGISNQTNGGGGGGGLWVDGDGEFANFNYIEYLTFKAYVEQHGTVSAMATTTLAAATAEDIMTLPQPLLRLDGRPIIPPPPLSPSVQPLVRRRITTRAVTRLKRMNPSMISLSSHHSILSSSQASDDTLVPKTEEQEEELVPPLPSNVPIDASVW